MNFGNITDSFKNPGSGSVRVPSPDDFTTIFTDIKTAVMEFAESMMSGAKKSTLGASFTENASHIIGLAVLILGFVLYIQVQIGNEEASKDARNTNKYATSIIDDIDAEKPSSKISKRVTIELFTPTHTPTPTLENPHEPSEQTKREPMTADNASVASIGTAVENTVIGAVSNLLPNGPSMETREKLQQKSATCKSTDGFCKLNHDKLEKVCSDITSQGTCSEKCCCGWVKFSNTDKSGVEPKAGSGVLNSLGISPDGKCVAGSVDGPDLTFGRDIDYYYYMGECMKGVCKPKGSKS